MVVCAILLEHILYAMTVPGPSGIKLINVNEEVLNPIAQRRDY